MTQMNLLNASDELRWFLRNNLTDRLGRGTDATANFTATAGQTVFTISVAYITNIKSVTVASVLKSYGFDYSVAMTGTAATITLSTGATLNDAVAIVYHYGATMFSWVMADFPRADVTLANIPLVNIMDVSAVGREIALNATTTRVSMLKSITVYDIDATKVRNTLTEMKNAFLSHKKTFYNFSLIIPVGMGRFDTLPHTEGQKEVVYNNLDVEIPYIWEGTS